MRRTYTAMLFLALSLNGCATMAKQRVREQGEAQCRRNGKIFVEREVRSQGGLFGTVVVSGQCVGPDDTGYADAKTAKDADEAKRMDKR